MPEKNCKKVSLRELMSTLRSSTQAPRARLKRPSSELPQNYNDKYKYKYKDKDKDKVQNLASLIWRRFKNFNSASFGHMTNKNTNTKTKRKTFQQSPKYDALFGYLNPSKSRNRL